MLEITPHKGNTLKLYPCHYPQNGLTNQETNHNHTQKKSEVQGKTCVLTLGEIPFSDIEKKLCELCENYSMLYVYMCTIL